MAVFSTSNARQLYVAKSLKSDVTDADIAGTISVHSNKSGDLYFKYKGADTTMRSDLIPINTISGGNAQDAVKLSRPLSKVEVTLDPNINGGNIVSGQDYILRIYFREWIGVSPEDIYNKYGMVHTYPGMTVVEFYKELKKSLEFNFSNFESNLLTFTLDSETAPTKLIIEEREQVWKLGLIQDKPLVFEVQNVPITVGGDEMFWATIKKVTATSFVKNGKVIADMEYFYMGERGDQYRNLGFPRIIQTTYLVDPSLEYNTIDLHFYYAGDGIEVQKSEKQVTLVIPKVGATPAASNKLANDIITIINTKAGTVIPLLSIV